MNTIRMMRMGTAMGLALLLPFAAVTPASAQAMPWTAHSDDPAVWQPLKQELQTFGEGFASATALYDHFRTASNGGITLTWADMEKPAYDWSGVFTRTKGGLSYDPDVKADELTADLTPAGAAARDEKIAQIATTGGEYDPISDCRAPGFPRWITEPFLHEYVVTPKQVWLMNEMVNDVRRVYTDGRPHTAPEDAYPTWNGDTIGFWDGEILVTHTAYLMDGQYQRGTQPDYSDQTEVVERWRKVDPITIQSDVWIFDPVNLAKPWYTRQSWTKLDNDEYLLRLRYWDCRENMNNDIIVTGDGSSQFPDFDFVDDDASVSDDDNIKNLSN